MRGNSPKAKPLLSILLCALSGRGDTFFPPLIKSLHRQAEGLPVEILFLGDNKYMSVGEKRNRLIEMAHGAYTVFVDDDDRISGDYVKRIHDALARQRPDCVCFHAEITHNGQNPGAVMYSKRYRKNYDRDGIYYRTPNHLMVLSSKISKRFKFPPVNHGEDAQFARRILPHLRSEVIIPRTLYYYDFNTETSETFNQMRKRR